MTRAAVIAVWVTWIAAAVWAQDRPLDVGPIQPQDAEVRQSAGAWVVSTGHAQPFPGVQFPPAGDKWDLSSHEYVAMDVKNLGEQPVTIHARVDNPGADGTRNCSNGSIEVRPGQSATLRVVFSRKSEAGSRLFGMRGYPPEMNPKGTMDPANVIKVLVFVARPKIDQKFEIRNLRAGGKFDVAMPPDKWFPFIDTFGQYMHRDWPGKVHSEQELQQKRQEEAKELADKPGPEEWNRYGGWKNGPTLKATGSFRVEKREGKWWLVDPEGKLFWSNGIDCVRMGDATPIDERESWFADFPGNRPEFQEFVRPRAFALHGYYAGKTPRCFSFAGANLKRKYGANWRQETAELAHRRLRSWGANTIANWSEPSVYLLKKTPYVCTLGSGRKMIEGSQGYWGKFPDAFDPEFKEQTRQRIAAGAARTAGDPWCIGYFVDNEMSWGDEVSLGLGTLKSPADQAAKKVFIDDLKKKYGTIEKLNEAWGTKHASWEALLASRDEPDRNRARADLAAFYTRLAEEYFMTVKDAIRQAAPNQLYLGCRFAWVNPLAVGASIKYCDVVSYNLYRRSVAEFKLPIDADVPLIIGEFHFGALDRGMFHTGLVPTASQDERARSYADYLRGALRHPQFVGAHWFQYQDEPTTGRVYDEENYQIGFVDQVDTPYPEIVKACREVGYSMYGYRAEGK